MLNMVTDQKISTVDCLVGCDCKNMPEGKTTFLLSENEKQLVISYRSKTEMQPAVKKLLDLHFDKK